MCYKNTEFDGRGRPVQGLEKRSVNRNIRIEPYLDKRLDGICRMLGVSKSEAIRQGIVMYINEAEKIINEHYERGTHL